MMHAVQRHRMRLPVSPSLPTHMHNHTCSTRARARTSRLARMPPSSPARPHHSIAQMMKFYVERHWTNSQMELRWMTYVCVTYDLADAGNAMKICLPLLPCRVFAVSFIPPGPPPLCCVARAWPGPAHCAPLSALNASPNPHLCAQRNMRAGGTDGQLCCVGVPRQGRWVVHRLAWACSVNT